MPRTSAATPPLSRLQQVISMRVLAPSPRSIQSYVTCRGGFVYTQTCRQMPGQAWSLTDQHGDCPRDISTNVRRHQVASQTLVPFVTTLHKMALDAVLARGPDRSGCGRVHDRRSSCAPIGDLASRGPNPDAELQSRRNYKWIDGMLNDCQRDLKTDPLAALAEQGSVFSFRRQRFYCSAQEDAPRELALIGRSGYWPAAGLVWSPGTNRPGRQGGSRGGLVTGQAGIGRSGVGGVPVLGPGCRRRSASLALLVSNLARYRSASSPARRAGPVSRVLARWRSRAAACGVVTGSGQAG